MRRKKTMNGILVYTKKTSKISYFFKEYNVTSKMYQVKKKQRKQYYKRCANELSFSHKES